MLKPITKILGKTKFKVKVLNHAKHINRLCSQDVKCYNVKKLGINELELQVDAINSNKVKKEFNNCENISYESKSGLLFALNYLKKNLIVFISFCICFCSFFYFNLFIWQIKIYSNSNQLEAEIFSYCENNKIKIGKLKKDYKIDEIKQTLLKNYSEVALIDVEITGQTLVINARSAVKNATENFILKPLISEFDAIVEYINIKSGTPKVKVGEVVKSGTILVEPYLFKNGKYECCEVVGDVSLRCFYSEDFIFHENTTTKVRTGNKVIQNNFTLFKNFDKLKIRDVGFDEFETSVVCDNICFFNLIPLKLTSIEIYELTIQNVHLNFLENQQMFENNVKNKVYEKIATPQIIKESIESKKIEDGVYKTTVSVEFIKQY